jgi:hypothetical protein
VINAIRAHLAELGIVAPVGRNGVEELLGVVADPSDKRVPEIARACLAALGAQLRVLKAQILEFDRMINAWHRSNETSKRLDEIPGVGPALATALVASVADPKAFRSGRDFSARTHGCTDQPANVKKTLANSEPSTHGTKTSPSTRSRPDAKTTRRSRRLRRARAASSMPFTPGICTSVSRVVMQGSDSSIRRASSAE